MSESSAMARVMNSLAVVRARLHYNSILRLTGIVRVGSVGRTGASPLSACSESSSSSSLAGAKKTPEPAWSFDLVVSKEWREKEKEILKDIEPIILLAKDILHSSRYEDGGCLSAQDEKEIVEKLLAHHPNASDKIGCGLNSIAVDRHPSFKQSRCLFVVRTDGTWEDFSYQKCLQWYIRDKYSTYAEKFIQRHFNRKM